MAEISANNISEINLNPLVLLPSTGISPTRHAPLTKVGGHVEEEEPGETVDKAKSIIAPEGDTKVSTPIDDGPSGHAKEGVGSNQLPAGNLGEGNKEGGHYFSRSPVKELPATTKVDNNPENEKHHCCCPCIKEDDKEEIQMTTGGHRITSSAKLIKKPFYGTRSPPQLGGV
ncbi:hypothetical protein GYMLUDRAFT_695390 [Collybiopsis luxurians FD-317 M1]|uniref:Uncharacterized protein n=1 Tax=Collybiopsis luxurians FD-317 M1 TaxID=944289 RepID=A0A0D0CJ57_9AGAR|nr:hypothetical protein GYMLUDRAFT_695390 [Collybiopsis luxurians FD-317 M1]